MARDEAGASEQPVGALPLPGVIEILDQLAALASTAPRVPWSSRAVVDADELAALVTELRERLPGDLAEAHQIILQRQAILLDAEIAARDLLTEAEAEADRLVRQHTVLREAEARAARLTDEASRRSEDQLAQAKATADSLITTAQTEADQQRQAADAYSLEVLRRLEGQLTGFLVSVRKGISALEEPTERR